MSRRFINFASVIPVALLVLVLCSCKGRTMESMEPTGDTIEVVIMPQDTISKNL